MTNLNIAAFGGMLPRRNRQKLPPQGSELAENCDLLSGDLRALRGLLPASNVDASGGRAAFRIPAALRGDVDDPPPTSELSDLDLWYVFGAEFSHLVKGPLVNDKYNRWYFTEEGGTPRYQNVSRQLRGEPSLRLGVPRPLEPVTVTPATTPVDLPFATYPGDLSVVCTENAPYSQLIFAEGGVPTYTWTVTTGSMPNGLELNENTGVISGAPTTPGTFPVSIRVRDSETDPAANEVTHSFTFTVNATDVPVPAPNAPTFYATAVQPVRVGEPFFLQIQVAGGGRDPKHPDYPNSPVTGPNYVFDILKGALPQGLSLDDETGLISGIPTIAGSQAITLLVKDQYNVDDKIAFTINVSADPLTPVEGSDFTVTRCYVYTFVTAAGEEGPPSEPTCAEGADDDSWTICNLATSPPAPWDTESLISKKRIYRTVTGQTGGSFFFVDEVAMDVTCYEDSVSTDDVSLNAQLESDSWEPPPDGLVGLIRHPNGFLIGFLPPHDIYFSEPYRPHAWPPEYVLSAEGVISALGVFGASVGVPTNAHPYVCSGSHPANMSLIKSNVSEPCLSRHGVVSTESGVVYPSANGLVLLSPAGVSVMTKQLVTRGEWNTRYQPQKLRGAQFGFEYFGVAINDGVSGGIQQGFIFSPAEQNSIFTEVNMALQRDFQSLQTDRYNGQVYTIVNGKVYWWANFQSLPEVYRWRTMEFVTPKPVNFGAYRIDFDAGSSDNEQAPDSDIAFKRVWNEERMASGALDPLNHKLFNECRQVDDSGYTYAYSQNRAPIGGSCLFDLFSNVAYVEVLLYADSELKYHKTLSSPGRYRLPLGYKADIWQVELRGTADLHHFKMAETGKELARV